MNSLFRQINMKNSNDNTDNSLNEALFENFPQHTHTYSHTHTLTHTHTFPHFCEPELPEMRGQGKGRGNTERNTMQLSVGNLSCSASP